MDFTLYNIVLVGPSGSGKSTVGRVLAQQHSRTFIDMDLEIEHRLGCSISDCFAEQGEAVFRDAESQLCEELAQRNGLVIAAGGGVLERSQNRRALAQNGILVNLHAPIDVLLARLAPHADRPLLRHGQHNSRERFVALLNKRRQTYQAVPVQVNTAGLNAQAVADRIIEQIERQWSGNSSE